MRPPHNSVDLSKPSKGVNKRMCCNAITASCEACKFGLTVVQFCSDPKLRKRVPDCKTKLAAANSTTITPNDTTGHIEVVSVGENGPELVLEDKQTSMLHSTDAMEQAAQSEDESSS